ncbi:MAG: SDR family oxidoreductase [Acidobacteria bacterium]|nr:SDR family oxidoreductase [Acidobacteriota bacterium]
MPLNYLIFGATGGIGTTLCRQLQVAGHRVFASGRDPHKLAMLSSELGTPPLLADATVPAEVADAFAQAGAVDGVANCVGSLLLKPAHITTDEEWAAVLRTNLDSAFYVLRAGAKAMMSTGGSIVLVSSAAGRLGLQNHEAIAAAKAGIIGLTLSAAATYAPRNIRVNCVAPGLTATPLTTRITANETAAKASMAMHPLGRLGAPEDVAAMMAFLLLPAAAWITGQTFGVDGGLGTVRSKS